MQLKICLYDELQFKNEVKLKCLLMLKNNKLQLTFSKLFLLIFPL